MILGTSTIEIPINETCISPVKGVVPVPIRQISVIRGLFGDTFALSLAEQMPQRLKYVRIEIPADFADDLERQTGRTKERS